MSDALWQDDIVAVVGLYEPFGPQSLFCAQKFDLVVRLHFVLASRTRLVRLVLRAVALASLPPSALWYHLESHSHGVQTSLSFDD